MWHPIETRKKISEFQMEFEAMTIRDLDARSMATKVGWNRITRSHSRQKVTSTWLITASREFPYDTHCYYVVVIYISVLIIFYVLCSCWLYMSLEIAMFRSVIHLMKTGIVQTKYYNSNLFHVVCSLRTIVYVITVKDLKFMNLAGEVH